MAKVTLMSREMKKSFIALIKATDNPMAPIIMDSAYADIMKLGAMLSAAADEDTTQKYANQLLNDFPKEMDHIASDPSFVCALCSLLANAMVAYTRKVSQ